MLIHQRIACRAGSALLILRCADGPRAAGKYLVGRPASGPCPLAAVLDDSLAFHREIAAIYGLHPLGGGWCEIDHRRHAICLSGRSSQFGPEPLRALTVSLFERAFPSYTVWAED